MFRYDQRSKYSGPIHLLQGEREMVYFAFSLVQEPGTIVYYVDLVLKQESLKSEAERN